MNIDNTLQERGSRYGSFEEHAKIAQALQDVIRENPDNWDKLPPIMRQALTVICDKIARMLNGDPFYVDNWHDIIGYARLVENYLNK